MPGEAAWGSLRYLCARPLDRTRLLLSRAAVAAAFSLAAIVVVPMTSLLAGGLAFGWRALTVVDLEHTTVFAVAGTTLSPAAVAGRLGLATGVVALSLVSTFAATLLLSTLTRSPFSAAAGGSGSA